MSTHTPGPWLIEPTDTSKAIVTDDCVICEMAVWAYEHQKEIEANAHLIAAAPDLLEAAIALQVAAMTLRTLSAPLLSHHCQMDTQANFVQSAACGCAGWTRLVKSLRLSTLSSAGIRII